MSTRRRYSAEFKRETVVLANYPGVTNFFARDPK